MMSAGAVRYAANMRAGAPPELNFVNRTHTMAAAKFQRVRTQFIAALGDPKASGGDNATQWGIWTVDPGPRGVPIGQWKQLEAADGVAPAGWKHDPADWWVEECASPPQVSTTVHCPHTMQWGAHAVSLLSPPSLDPPPGPVQTAA